MYLNAGYTGASASPGGCVTEVECKRELMLTLSERFEAAEELLTNGRWEEAEFLLDEILAVNPHHGDALNARGRGISERRSDRGR